ncbi:MAG: hypothetical protein U0559_17780 [Anaerolineae bacterium]
MPTASTHGDVHPAHDDHFRRRSDNLKEQFDRIRQRVTLRGLPCTQHISSGLNRSPIDLRAQRAEIASPVSFTTIDRPSNCSIGPANDRDNYTRSIIGQGTTNGCIDRSIELLNKNVNRAAAG